MNYYSLIDEKKDFDSYFLSTGENGEYKGNMTLGIDHVIIF